MHIQALIFDVFGTTVDWHGSVVRELAGIGKRFGVDGDWSVFAKTWRRGYIEHAIGSGVGSHDGALTMDELHRQLLDKVLGSPEWKYLGDVLDKKERDMLNSVWHRLDGWSEASTALAALKKHTLVVALSNGNLRLLIDVAKHANLPWDAVLSADFFGSFKPDIRVYQGALRHLSIAPENCAMVACHLWDLQGAARAGMKTIYVRRKAEEPLGDDEDVEVKSKEEGGEVDLVVNDFTELGRVVLSRK
ncbi:HAD-like domain-containing protein [Mycena amicta]|nr:HAD-like domain-containing protein [Mycena amicta]